MSEITRYDMVSDDGLDSLDLGPCPDGDYVRYVDHARMLAAKEAEVAHAAEVLRLVGEFESAAHKRDAATMRFHKACEKDDLDAMDEADSDMQDADRLCDTAESALLAAARKMKEQP